MSHCVRKTRRHAKRPRECVTTGQINRVRRYFNQAHAFREPIRWRMEEIRYEPGVSYPDIHWEEYNRLFDQLDKGFLRLRRENRVNQRLIEKVMRHKGWTREQVNQPIPADA